jgi:hypothetical protein
MVRKRLRLRLRPEGGGGGTPAKIYLNYRLVCRVWVASYNLEELNSQEQVPGTQRLAWYALRSRAPLSIINQSIRNYRVIIYYKTSGKYA